MSHATFHFVTVLGNSRVWSNSGGSLQFSHNVLSIRGSGLREI
jgi:hypothetical protein